MLIYSEINNMVINLDNIDSIKVVGKNYLLFSNKSSNFRFSYDNNTLAKSAISKILQAKKVKKEIVKI